MANENTVVITDDSFDNEITNYKGVALIDLWAEWCGPCVRLSPVVEEIADEYKGKVKIGKMDVDSNPNTPTKFGIMSIPTLLIFKDGAVFDKIVGVVPKDQIVERLEKAIS